MIGINPYRIGMSEAGKRIHDAGLRFAATLPEPEPAINLELQKREERNAPVRFIFLPEVSIPGRCHEIIEEVAAQHKMTGRALRGRSRYRKIMLARFEAVFRCASETDISLAMIGRVFNRDHTTIGAAIMRYSEMMGIEPPRGLSWRRKKDQRRERARRKKEQAKAIQYARDAA